MVSFLKPFFKTSNMNITKKALVSALSFSCMAILLTSCKKQLNINENPSLPSLTQGTPSVVFPAAVLATTGKVGGDLAIVGGIWSQFFTQSDLAQQYTQTESYNLPSTDNFVNGVYDVLFTQALEDYKFVTTKSAAEGDWNYYLLGTVMNAYTTAVMVDLYDQMPYSQALQGSADLNPKFDSGYAIYTTLISSIDTALSKNLSALTVTAPGSQDLVFGGNMANWIAFATTLKLKLYLRHVNAYPSVAAAGIAALYAGNPSFLTVDASVTNFTNTPERDNPMYEQNIRTLNTTTNLKASTTFVSWLQANTDPRIVYFFGSDSVTSINQGDYANINAAYQAAPPFAQTPLDPVEFISTAESYFLQAEADLRYFGGSKANSLYDQGVLAAFVQEGLDGSSFIAPGGAYAFPVSGTMAQQLEAIIVQKWASCAYGCHGIESYFEQMRTGYPVRSAVYSNNPGYIPGQLVIGPNSSLPAGQYAKRFVYAYDETSRNTNAPQTTIPETTPVWWGLNN
jgi:hypothetical protein